MTASPSAKRRLIVVCQNRSCLRSGSDAVLAALQAANLPVGTLVQPTGCLGQCGAGPMVQVNPDGIWYCQVRVADIPEIVAQHLVGDRPVQRLLHPRLHPHFDASSYEA